MAIAIHRDTDSRACGATTVVSGQGTVFANGLLVSVDADPNSHGAGALTAACNQVFVNGKMVVIVGNSAAADSLCPPLGGAHCAPSSTGGSGNVFVGG
jgi:cation diffusion facilitator CzcD-associated flavoprotein CzcO